MEQTLQRKEVIEFIKELSDKQLVELFYEATKERRYNSYGEESHFVLAKGVRLQDDDGTWEKWQLQIIGIADREHYQADWADDVPLCQDGGCCNYEAISWAKYALCPLCGKQFYAT